MSATLDHKDHSDKDISIADTVTKIVMAEQITQDVVKEAQSMGSSAPIDDPATSSKDSAGNGKATSEPPNADPKPSDTVSNISTNATSTDASRGSAEHASDKADDDGSAIAIADSNISQQPSAVTGEMKEQLVNGDSGEHSASEAGSQQAQGDASGGSDTDISRPGSVDPTKDRSTGHLRSNSVKKPTSFKSVSVTKNFLAKSAAPAPTTRSGEKVAPAGQTAATAQQTAKPRLVAKSGSGLGGVSRGLSKLNGAGSGPDASKVWNKNQPVPPPPPKQFTDEELKQQYGIHLATRLQADESGKEAKWADIDDDEDDWAPDTVQWMDGTKSTVAAVENQPPVEEVKPPAKPDTPVEIAKPAPPPVTTTPPPSSTSGTKTILKPGGHSTGGKSGLVLKGAQPEKPTLVAKPSVPAPVKSPWAQLPPVEKVSPVQINPPMQPPPPGRYSRDSVSYDALPPAPAAKEIAPDDFNRSWRDDRGNRELFNSHSGRYEPVRDMRRGSFRDNNNFRQPSVLQRPSHDGPAEPSAAFQTSRTSADGPVWSRRRNSSNVSGGSGRRMSIDRRGVDLPSMPLDTPRRESWSMNGVDGVGPGTPRQALPPRPQPDHFPNAVQEQHPPWVQKQTSPNVAYAQPASPYGSVDSAVNPDPAAPGAPVQPPQPVQPAESAVEVQNRLMREKLERARLAKQKEREREEQEEAERKERLRKKLEALGMGDEAKSKTKEQSPARAADKSPQKEKAVPVPLQSPPKPPVPTSEGEVAQYGMMKVHQPHPVKRSSPPESITGLKPGSKVEVAPKPSPSPVKAQRAEAQPKHTAPSSVETAQSNQPPANNFLPHNRNTGSQLDQSEAQRSDIDSRAAPPTLKSAHPPSTPAWSQQQQPPRNPWATSAGSNVWGPPQTKERALGNGTFDSGYNRGQPRSAGQQLPPQSQSNQPNALTLGSTLKPSPPQAQSISSQPLSQGSMSVTTVTLPPQQVNVPAKPSSKLPSPGPVARPSVGGWADFHNAIRNDDQALVARNMDYIERAGKTNRPEMRETYADAQGKKQSTMHLKVGGSASSTAAIADVKSKEEASKAINDVAPSQSAGQATHLPPSGPGARSSRFFPRASDTPAQPPATSSKSDASDSPPPPETQSHPVYGGDSGHPTVKLPKPSPRVRLPPPAVEAPVQAESSVRMPPRSTMGLGARPLALNPEWQARFNGLLGKTSPSAAPASIAKGTSALAPIGHQKPSSLAVAASSKAPLEVRAPTSSATVSLPSSVGKKTLAEDNGEDVTTCICAETILLEEREFGSLPAIKLPKVPHLAANEPAMPAPTSRPNSKFQRPLDIMTKLPVNMFSDDYSAEGIMVAVRLGTLQTAVTKILPKKRGKGKGPNNRGSKRNFTPTGTATENGQNVRPRKSSNYQGQGSNSQSPATRGSGNANAWSSSRPGPSHSNSWNRRTTAPVH